MKTFSARKEDVQRKWFLVDAEGKSLGRMATQIATILRGKHKPQYTPHVDTGDMVVVINADKIKMTGNKWSTKKYFRRSRFFGSVKETTAEEMKAKNPTFIVEDAVRGMLPKTKLGRSMFSKLKVYKDGEHPHHAQKPEALTL